MFHRFGVGRPMMVLSDFYRQFETYDLAAAISGSKEKSQDESILKFLFPTSNILRGGGRLTLEVQRLEFLKFHLPQPLI